MYEMTLEKLKDLIASNEVKDIILDTDAYNEVDDQYCLAYCMRSPERVNLLSVNAAPFLNERSTSPADGMEKSYNEIFKVMKLVDPAAQIPVYRGSTAFLTDKNTPIESDAAENIIRTVQSSDRPVIVVAIGAITNIASALIKCPDLAHGMGVVWLGGNALHAPHTYEFNMKQDVPASQIVFDSGVPLVQVPCLGVCTEMVTTVPELRYYLEGKNSLCDYLCKNVVDAVGDAYARGRIIWDITAAAVLIRPDACEFVTIPRPLLTPDYHYAFDLSRAPYVYVRRLNREIIYGDVFKKLIG